MTADDELSAPSARYWFPKIFEAGHPVPRTCIVETGNDFFQSLSGEFENAVLDKEIYMRVEMAVKGFGFPCFLRSDLASAKHSGPKGFRVDNVDALLPVLRELAQANLLRDQWPAYLMVREWLDLSQPLSFTAFDGLVIGREWRFFATPEKTLCAHPYWPETSIRDPDRTEWRDRLWALNRPLESQEYAFLGKLASLAAKQCRKEPAWSIDFAYDRRGVPWLIDMAPARKSFHVEGCEARHVANRAPEDEKKGAT